MKKFLVIGVLLLFQGVSLVASKQPTTPLAVTPKKAKKKAKTTARGASKVLVSQKNATTVLQLTETEIWDGVRWRAVESRWTDASGETTQSPDKQGPPEGTSFDGDWKIVTSSSRDPYGWEYVIEKPYPVRHRIWLRTFVPDETKKAVVAKRKMPKWIQMVVDDFNFKGFGWSFYNSFINPTSFGVAFRLPLTFNFDFWERHPALPSVSTSLCLYYPALAAILCSFSLRVEWIKWATARTVALSKYGALWIVWLPIRGLILAASALLFPITRKLINVPMPMEWPATEACMYSRNIDERIGCSVSWRVSPERGYHFRVTYWHDYAPTLTSLWELLQLTKITKTVPAWFPRRSAAVALSTGGPTLDAPYCFCTGALSLSGFYFKPQHERVVVQPAIQQNATAAPATTVLQLAPEDTKKALSGVKS